MVYSIKPLIIGAKGFIGKHFYRYFQTYFPDLIGTHYGFSDTLYPLDLEHPTLNFPVDGYRYALITGGIGSPYACWQNAQKSYRCNVEGPINLGKELLKRGITPIFFSTDYVFDGLQEVYTENVPTAPLNEYGRQKAELERYAVELDALVIRLSKVYGVEKGDGAFFDTMAAALVGNQSVRAVYDQEFAPIFIEDVVKGVAALMQQHARGIVNMASHRSASRWQMALTLAKKLGVKEQLIEKISLNELQEPFQRPKCLRLISAMSAISWEEGIEKIVEGYTHARK